MCLSVQQKYGDRSKQMVGGPGKGYRSLELGSYDSSIEKAECVVRSAGADFWPSSEMPGMMMGEQWGRGRLGMPSEKIDNSEVLLIP
jgi:hypothetical protein